MAVEDGGQKYWIDGLPWDGLGLSPPYDEGQQKFWQDGLPSQNLLVLGQPSPPSPDTARPRARWGLRVSSQ